MKKISTVNGHLLYRGISSGIKNLLEYQDKLDNPSYQTITTLMAHSGGSLNYPTDALYTKNQN